MTLTDQRLARLERKTRCINCNTQFFANLAAFPTVGKDNVLYVDESNILQIVNPNFKQEDLIPSCTCCTHTLNGIPISKAE